MSKSNSAVHLAAKEPELPGKQRVFGTLAGIWVGLAMIKFGNPVILDHLIPPPANAGELLISPWPFGWGVLLSIVVFGFAVANARFRAMRDWLFWLPAAWLGWTILSGTQTVAPRLTNPTLVHFTVTVLAFYVGWLALARYPGAQYFWIPVILSFSWVMLVGFEQHYGGLEATRRAFYEQENWQMYPREYLLKIATNRIFSTLVYPNALAGIILLLGPILTWQLWRLGNKWPRMARAIATGLFVYAAVACLYWTGSKGGWLIAVAVTGLLFLQLPGNKRGKILCVIAIGVIGLTAFFVKYSAYFKKGAPSASARLIYWEAAWKTAMANPVFGTGPGTFAIPFAKIKPEGAEMARLVHNDYLEQASDSGLAGALIYVTMIAGLISRLYRYSSQKDWNFKLVLLGLTAWAMQGLIEFGLYVPGLAWPAFLLLGYCAGETEREPLKREKVEMTV